jgi:hypothetical protein
VAVASLDGGPVAPDTVVEFVRFCRGRRRVAWPEMYDEMCAVARRRLFRGWGFDELADNGVEFGLFHLPALADTTRRVLLEEETAAMTVEADRCAATPAA